MKIFGFILCVVFVSNVFADEAEDKKMELATFEECVTENNPSAEDINILKEKKSAPTTKEGKCTLACMMKKFKLMNDNGKFDKHSALAMAEKISENEKDVVINAINICGKEVKEVDDHCENAVVLLECAMKYGARAFI